MFDWATQPFFSLILTFVFAPYFAAHLAADPVAGQAEWGYATAVAGLAIAGLSPVLGSIADAGGGRKHWIAGFSLLLVAGSTALWWAAPGMAGSAALALVAFAIATVGAEFATVFNNAMMPGLVEDGRLGGLSGTGWGVGYLGGLVSLVLMLGLMVADPSTGRTLFGVAPIFGLDPATYEGDRAAGPFSALWYVIFVLPLFLFTPDVPRRLPLRRAIGEGLGNLGATLGGLRRHANTLRFLLANMIYKDGLAALFAFGGIYATGVFGWTTTEVGVFGILIIVAATVGALAGGRLDDRIGPKKVILGSLVVLAVASLGILSIDRDHVAFVIPVAPADSDALFAGIGEKVYLLLGAAIGIVAGPLQAASRTLMIRISPPEKLTEFFGLFALSGKVTSFAGPVLVASLTALSGSQRVGISVLVAFFVVALWAMAPVRVAGPAPAP
ncbi:MAG: MFS transporter [Bauldia sp.]|nr:MFS transporter [Bauldia sp.]